METSYENDEPKTPLVEISEGAQCPVAHAPDQPLPPGHPPTKNAIQSTLKPPTGAKCVFFRTTEDLMQTPPLSRKASNRGFLANLIPTKREPRVVEASQVDI